MNNKNDLDYRVLKKPYMITTIIISVIIVAIMYLTQAYWINVGILMIYDEYPINEVNRNLDMKIYIVDGIYNNGYLNDTYNNSKLLYISSNSDSDCKLKNGHTKLLVTNTLSRDIATRLVRKTIVSDVEIITVLKVLEGC